MPSEFFKAYSNKPSPEKPKKITYNFEQLLALQNQGNNQLPLDVLQVLDENKIQAPHP